jgi:hypothetical protein
MSKRTTHSDLAQLLVDLSEKLKRVPEGYCVSDPSSLRLITDAARILVEQDQRIDDFTVAARESTDDAMRKLLARKSETYCAERRNRRH